MVPMGENKNDGFFSIDRGAFRCAAVGGLNSAIAHLILARGTGVGEDERARIAQRTREGLAAAKRKGIKLGNPKWRDSIEAARYIRSAKAAKQAKSIRPIIAGLRSSGIDTLTGLANALNERGIKTGQGGRWYPQTVKRVVEARA